MVRGMPRARISATVDAGQLEKAQAQPDLRDSERFDRALDLFVRQSTIDHEVAALALFPYEVDPVLNMGDAG